MIKVFTLTFLFSISAHAYNTQALKVNEQRTPYILEILLKHLQKYYTQSNLNQEELNELLVQLNLNSQNLSQDDLTFLSHFEINRTILNFKLTQGYQSNTLSSTDISGLNSKIKKFKELYTDLSLYVLTECLADFSKYLSDGKLDKLQGQGNLNQADLRQKNELKSYIKYSGKWINTAISLTPQEFNRTLSQTIAPSLKSINASLLAFKNYTKLDKTFDKVEILPQLSLLNDKATTVESDNSSSTQEKVLKSIEPDIPSDPKKEIDQIFEKKLDSKQE